jgi:hypothetical protein
MSSGFANSPTLQVTSEESVGRNQKIKRRLASIILLGQEVVPLHYNVTCSEGRVKEK